MNGNPLEALMTGLVPGVLNGDALLPRQEGHIDGFDDTRQLKLSGQSAAKTCVFVRSRQAELMVNMSDAH